MIPSLLVNDLNQFYSSEYPKIPPLSATGYVECAEGGRQISFVDAYFLHKYASSISPEATEYIDFVSTMLAQFREIEIYFNVNVKAEGDHKDAEARPGGWAGYGVLPLALAFYTLAKNGVEGDYLECGVFKGGSLTCMSHVANYLGRKAIAADTFAGLPEADVSGFWQKNQFAGRLDEVQSNLAAAGVPSAVLWEKGLFSDTLPVLERRIALMFLDTDLYNSSMSALESTVTKWSPGSMVASDGVSGVGDFSGGDYRPSGNESAAVLDFFNRRNIPFHAVWTGNGNMTLFGIKTADSKAPIYSTGFVHYLTNAFYVGRRFGDHIDLFARQDLPNIAKKSLTTFRDIADLIVSDILNEKIAGSYHIGGLEWKLANMEAKPQPKEVGRRGFFNKLLKVRRAFVSDRDQ
ncbi:TylF/MycF/NovP-related O-methyltransferase [Rhizobium sp. PL01]|uniref:TylF/MycF/NovP-related O-methyltransferase n=1 Tax=Rhizobium sp. PL01 TaxID=3085631 RepID=UPI0029811B87|nr:TylF/MycF/NovP-related O-methyltransferase [Rhizobium sp. PL01]MDW5317785.1 TylF/MycF/NovP-related O-methyltransferase [Rhizobium sp. PL01]